ncbi:hypothetical protein SAMN00777080_3887 [Aquiflexum balticum DSM 16537]|uniref:Uncharacterized protein n=1 Tax=Aquiflexum balticum DSM 16537 TaxID=758820 RepID=A0A1W2H8N8_9BACT|nr:hypothetical protein SAMN00777080_3887 [Aquiflexum balticum DSM 16537]
MKWWSGSGGWSRRCTMYEVPSTKTRCERPLIYLYKLRGGVGGDTHNGEGLGEVPCTKYQVPRPDARDL